MFVLTKTQTHSSANQKRYGFSVVFFYKDMMVLTSFYFFKSIKTLAQSFKKVKFLSLTLFGMI